MTAPTRTPIYADAIGGQWAMSPEEAIPWFIDNIVSAARINPKWRVDDREMAVQLFALDKNRIGFVVESRSGEIRLSADPLGWLVAVVLFENAEFCRFYIERVYEEYDLWPPGAGSAEGEAPGRIGKHITWMSLRVNAWPSLALLAGSGGWVNIAVHEDEESG